MIIPFKKVPLYLLLLLTLWGSAIAVQAQQMTDTLGAGLKEARAAGVSETTLNRMLALGYEKQVEPTTMGSLLSILARCQQENLPLQPFLSKIEEGMSKGVSAPRIEQLLKNKLEDYQFTRSLIAQLTKFYGQAEPVSPEYHVRLTETLYCGVSKRDLNQLLDEFPNASLPMVTRGAEVLASLKQMGFSGKLSEQIVDVGLKHGFFTREQRNFSRIVAVARQKGLQTDQIAEVALRIIESQGSQTDLSSQLGISAQDLERQSPRLGSDSSAGDRSEDEDSAKAPDSELDEAPNREEDQAGPGGRSNGDEGRRGDRAGPEGGSGGSEGREDDPAGSGGGLGSGGKGDPVGKRGGGLTVSSSGKSIGNSGESDTSSKAYAKKERQQKTKSVAFTATGKVAHIDTAGLTITLDIEEANHVLREHFAELVSFAISKKVEIRTRGSESGAFVLSLDEVKAGLDHVTVFGKRLADGTYLITHIVVHLDEREGLHKKETKTFMAVGKVADVDPGDLTMTLHIQKATGSLAWCIGELVPFIISEKVSVTTERSAPGVFDLDLNDIRAGTDKVRIVGRKLASGTHLITRIVVYLEE